MIHTTAPKPTFENPNINFISRQRFRCEGTEGPPCIVERGWAATSHQSLIVAFLLYAGQLYTLMLPGRILGLLTWPSQQSGFQDGVSRYPGSVHIVLMDCKSWADKLWNARLWSHLEIDLQRLGWRQKVVHTWILALDVVRLRRYFFNSTWLRCILRDI